MADEHTMGTIPRETAMPGIGQEAVATVGAAGAVLAIVGLAGVLPQLLAEVGVILVGASFVASQGSAARYLAALTGEERAQLRALPSGGAVTGEFVGGLSAALLGLLSLLGVAQPTLLAVAVILLGAVEIASGRSMGRVHGMMIEMANASPRVKAVARESAGASLGSVTFVGMGGVALGILALVIGSASLALVLVAVLALGLGTLFATATRAEHLTVG